MNNNDVNLYDDRDGWGPCCSDCEWRGHATKPCDVCEPLKRGDMSVLEKFKNVDQLVKK